MEKSLEEILEFITKAKNILDKSDNVKTIESNNYSVSVKVNFSLKSEIKKQAKEAGMTISAFVRYKLTQIFMEVK